MTLFRREAFVWAALLATVTMNGQTPAPGPVYDWSTLAGRSTLGSEEGGRLDARFNQPDGLVRDSIGNIFVADTGNHSVRRISVGGVVSTFAGTSGEPGYKDDTGAGARFRSPTKLAIDLRDNLYVADAGNFVIRKITPAGVVTTVAGRPGESGNANGAAATAQFADIRSLIVSPSDEIYVFDHHVRKIANGTVSDHYSGGTFTDPATGSAFTVTLTGELALNPTGDLLCTAHVAPWPTPGPCVMRVDGARNVAFFIRPEVLGQSTSTTSYAVALGPILADGVGGLFFSQSVRLYYGLETWVTHWTPSGGLVQEAESRDGSGRTELLRTLVRDDQQRLIATRESDSALVQFLPTRMVFAGTPRTGTPTDGTTSDARFSNLRGVGADSAGNIWVTDGSARHFVENEILGSALLRKVAANGVTTTVANSSAMAAPQVLPGPLAVDSSDNVYFTQRLYYPAITRIAPGGASTLLPDLAEARDSFQLASGGGAGSLALMGSRGLLAKWDATANQYRAVAGAMDNDPIRRIRLDGTGASARFATILGITTDSRGNFYVLDWANFLPQAPGDVRIRKVTPEGVVSTISGDLLLPSAKPGESAFPLEFAVDRHDRFFLLYDDQTVRLLSASDGTPVIVGGGSKGAGNRDGRGPAARFSLLRDLAIDAQGTLYVSDQDGTVIRKGVYIGLAPTITTQPAAQTVAEGATVKLTVVASGDPAPTYQWLHDGAIVAGATTSAFTITALRRADTGNYTVKVANAAGEVTSNSAVVALSGGSNPPSGGGGGGGAPSAGFLLVLTLLAAVRRLSGAR